MSPRLNCHVYLNSVVQDPCSFERFLDCGLLFSAFLTQIFIYTCISFFREEMISMTSFFKKLFGKKAKEELQNNEEAEKDESLTEETLSSASSAQPATSTPAPSAFPATKGTDTLFTEHTIYKAPGKSDTPPQGKWRCSKCERLMDELVKNCSFCGAAKDQ